jgi:hypothetical protein
MTTGMALGPEIENGMSARVKLWDITQLSRRKATPRPLIQ